MSTSNKHDKRLADYRATHSEAEAAELEALISAQQNDDTHYQRPQRKGSQGAQQEVLSLNAQPERPLDPYDRPKTLRYTEAGASLASLVCDITGARTSNATVHDRNAAHIDLRLNEPPERAWARIAEEAVDGFLEVLGYIVVADNGDGNQSGRLAGPWSGKLKRTRVRDDAAGAFVAWVDRYAHHPELDPEDASALVLGILVGWWRAQIVRWHEAGESFRRLERATGIPKSTVARMVSDAEDATPEMGETMSKTVTNEDVLEEVRQLRREQGERFAETRSILMDLAARVQAKHPDDAEVTEAVEHFLATIGA